MDPITILGYIILGSGLTALVLKLMILSVAWGDWSIYRKYSSDDPDRITAREGVIEGVGRILNVIAIVVLGTIWVVVTSSRPPSNAAPTPLAWAIVATLVLLAILPVLQGIRALMFRHELESSAQLIRDANSQAMSRLTTGQLLILRTAGEILRDIETGIDIPKDKHILVSLKISDEATIAADLDALKPTEGVVE